MLRTEKSAGLAAVVLRVAIACQCLALGWMHLYGATPINDFLVLGGFGSGPTQLVDTLAGLALVLLAGMVLARPVRWVLGLVAVWFLLHALAGWWNHATDSDAIFYQLGPAAQAVRWLAPVGLILLVSGRTRSAMWVLLIASCATFIGHGIKDVLLYTPYVDIINNSLTNYTELKWPLEKTQFVLRAIGVADIIFAGLLLLTRWRWLALPMALWGGIAAFSRITANGLDVWPDVLLRVCNGAAPFVVFLLLCAITKRTIASSPEPAAQWDFAPSDNAQRGTIPMAAPEPRSQPADRSPSPAISSSAVSSPGQSFSPPERPPPPDIYG